MNGGCLIWLSGQPSCARHSHNWRRPHEALQPLTLASTGYLVVLTSLSVEQASTTAALTEHQLRWAVAFKRMKAEPDTNRLLACDPAEARGWLLSHLTLALLIEGAAGEVLDTPPMRQAGPKHPARFGGCTCWCATPCSGPCCAPNGSAVESTRLRCWSATSAARCGAVHRRPPLQGTPSQLGTFER